MIHGTTRAKSFGKLVKLSLKNPNPLKRRRRSWSGRLSPQGAPFWEPEESSSNVSEAPSVKELLTASSLSGEAIFDFMYFDFSNFGRVTHF